MIEQIPVSVIYALAAIAAGVIGVLVPYVLKAFEDDTIEFSVAYVYGLLIQIVISAIALVPDTEELNIKLLLTVFAAGLGIQVTLNKAITVVRKNT